jgi:hypothetical protein
MAMRRGPALWNIRYGCRRAITKNEGMLGMLETLTDAQFAAMRT